MNADFTLGEIGQPYAFNLSGVVDVPALGRSLNKLLPPFDSTPPNSAALVEAHEKQSSTPIQSPSSNGLNN